MLAMFPALVIMYVRLARGEEQSAIAEFGAQYRRYMSEEPDFIPRLGDIVGGIVHGSKK